MREAHWAESCLNWKEPLRHGINEILPQIVSFPVPCLCSCANPKFYPIKYQSLLVLRPANSKEIGTQHNTTQHNTQTGDNADKHQEMRWGVRERAGRHVQDKHSASSSASTAGDGEPPELYTTSPCCLSKSSSSLSASSPLPKFYSINKEPSQRG